MIHRRFYLALVLACLASSLAVAVADEAVSCGGFVKLSSELSDAGEKTKLDYSALSLLLTSPDGGAVKYTGKVMPNGYYIIPVYDQASYVLKIAGPESWHFTPSSVKIAIANGQCNDGHDINFNLDGFQVTGSVAVDSKCTAADTDATTGVQVELLKGEKVVATTTSKDGKFAFENVLPGKYELRASHPDWSLAKSTLPVQVTWGAGAANSATFQVTGFDIRGAVRESSAQGEPVTNVDFVLYSKNAVKIDGCSVSDDLKSTDKSLGHAICSSKSDASGVFSLKQIPCGEYTVVPVYKSSAQASAVFDVVPAKHTVKVEAGTAKIEQPFVVKGFSIDGKVTDSKGAGIAGVTVTLKSASGASPASVTTGANGQYKLEQVVSGTYSLQAAKSHYTFTTISNIRVAPQVFQLPDLVPSQLALCGRVVIAQTPAGFDKSKFSVVLKSSAGSDLPTTTDSDGSYCFNAAPGAYLVAVKVSDKDKRAGLVLSPSERSVTIDNKPILNLDFSQALHKVSGRVKCLAPCDSSISVALYSLSGAGQPVKLGLTPPPSNVAADKNTGDFTFESVLPGKYQIAVEHPGDAWCWVKQTFEIEVKSGDVTNVEFVQAGYKLHIKSSHAIELSYALTEGDGTQKQENKETIKTGDNSFCLEASGVYKVKPLSCYQFGKDTFTFSTAQPKAIELAAKNFKVFGKIEAAVAQDAPSPKVSIAVQKSGASEPTHIETTKFAAKNGVQVFEYVYWAELGESVVLRPTTKENLFFFPATLTAGVETSACPPELPTFKARPGVYLEGSITPVIEGVAIKVLVADSNEAVANLPTVATDATGHYRAGPLPDDKKYTVSAQAEGFHLKADGKGNFRAQKLASIRVQIETTDSQPLPGVLLSLSGGEGYRKNLPTGPEGGFMFDKLFPGSYYLQPILIEYVFDPPSQEIEIDEGKEVKVTIKAKRVAYSTFGSVKSLNGKPERAVTLVATSESSRLETQTDENGNYRIRGFQPNQKYTLQVLSSSKAKLDRAAPAGVEIKAKDSDIRGVDFITFDQSQDQADLFGRVLTNRTLLSSITVQLIEEEKRKQVVVREAKLGVVDFFDFVGLAKREYILKIKTTLSSDVFEFATQDIKVNLEKSVNHVDLPFNAVLKSAGQDTPASSVFGLLFTILIGVGFYYNKKVLKLAKKHLLKEEAVKAKPTLVHDDSWVNNIVKNQQKSVSRR